MPNSHGNITFCCGSGGCREKRGIFETKTARKFYTHWQNRYSEYRISSRNNMLPHRSESASGTRSKNISENIGGRSLGNRPRNYFQLSTARQVSDGNRRLRQSGRGPNPHDDHGTTDGWRPFSLYRAPPDGCVRRDGPRRGQFSLDRLRVAGGNRPSSLDPAQLELEHRPRPSISHRRGRHLVALRSKRVLPAFSPPGQP